LTHFIEFHSIKKCTFLFLGGQFCEEVNLYWFKMMSCPSMSKQSDQIQASHNCQRRFSGLRKLCVMGGLKYVFDGSAAYTDWTDWP